MSTLDARLRRLAQHKPPCEAPLRRARVVHLRGIAKSADTRGAHRMPTHQGSGADDRAAPTASMLHFGGDLARIVVAMTQVAADLVFLDIPHRLARFLLEAAAPDGRVELPYTQSELAARLGVMRQTLNAALSRLAREGMVHVGSPRVVHLIDRNRLEAFVAHGGR